MLKKSTHLLHTHCVHGSYQCTAAQGSWCLFPSSINTEYILKPAFNTLWHPCGTFSNRVLHYCPHNHAPETHLHSYQPPSALSVYYVKDILTSQFSCVNMLAQAYWKVQNASKCHAGMADRKCTVWEGLWHNEAVNKYASGIPWTV
jgi:hypothetical protein